MPSEDFRLKGEEIQGSDEMDALKNNEEPDQFGHLDADESESTLAFDPDENRMSMSKKVAQNDNKVAKGINKDKTSFDLEKRASVLVRAKPNAAATTLEDFDLQLQLGRGTFGKVFLAEHKKTKVLYAIKVIRKDVLIEYDQVESTKLEKDILFAADHPNLVGMDFLF